jgi:hypothetical protein
VPDLAHAAQLKGAKASLYFILSKQQDAVEMFYLWALWKVEIGISGSRPDEQARGSQR